MSKSITRSRLVRAGLATGAVATLLLSSATPAFAADVALTLTPATGPVGGGNTVSASATGFLTGVTTVGARFSTLTTCPATFGTTSATNMLATATKVDNDTATVVVPAVGLSAYRICFYNGALGTSAIVGSGAYTVTAAAPVLNNVTGPAGGGNTVTATSAGNPYLTTATATPGVTFSTGACPSTYTTTAPNIAGTAVKTSATVATVTVPTTLTAPNAYNICLYAGTLGTSALLGTSSATYSPDAPTATLSAVSGPNAGGNTITATATGFLTGVTAPGVTFSTVACPGTYTASPANRAVTATVTDNNTATFAVPAGVLAPATYNVCVYNGTTNASSGLIGKSSATYSVSLPAVTLSPAVGPTGGGNTITATSPSTFLTGVASPGATFINGAACAPTYTTTGYQVATATRITTSKAAIAVPAGVTLNGGDITTPYNLCIYNGTSVGTSTLVGATAVYNVAAAVTLDPGSPVTPAGGPAQGGSLVTINGTGFPTTPGGIISASIGGAPLTNITPVSSTAFTGVTTARAAGTANVSVTTASGTVTRPSAFVYSNGITVAPNTAAPGSTTFLDIFGVGFAGLTFTPADPSTGADAHVYLVKDAYEATDVANAGEKDNPPVDECTSVIVISDVELICTLDLSGGLSPTTGATNATPVEEGTYTVTVVNTGAVDPAAGTLTQSIVSSGSTFTVAPY